MCSYKYSLLAVCVFCFAFRGGVRAYAVGRESDATTEEAHTGSLLDCITCLSKQPQLNEMIRAQKIAHRLEYIRQQLNSNLHVQTPPTDPPKLEALPGFLVDQLVNSPSDRDFEHVRESGADKQMVLFPEEGKGECAS